MDPDGIEGDVAYTHISRNEARVRTVLELLLVALALGIGALGPSDHRATALGFELTGEPPPTPTAVEPLFAE
jgi:hypothetical protein